jgi:hypothetical protein
MLKIKINNTTTVKNKYIYVGSQGCLFEIFLEEIYLFSKKSILSF